ncbi:23S rRNA (guanosine(2251)-2'-O)-methyltransferase RlmB [Alphaproteobacteria bacterium]|nr:23S rRNA (guanosine(2251)-2'-O)-methyltransferase RlmB [Alphaproteobacteria bacterium]
MRQKKLKNQQSGPAGNDENKAKNYKKSKFSKGSHSPKTRIQTRTIKAAQGCYLMWGFHAVSAALANPTRLVRRIYASPHSKDAVTELIQNAACKTHTDMSELIILAPDEFDTPPVYDGKRVHQHMMIEVQPLEALDLTDIIFGDDNLRLIILDQITDSRNVGAIIRSAKAFGCDAIIMTKHNAPTENGSLARAAAGALENVPIITVTNLSRTIETLKTHDVCCIGLDAAGDNTLERFSSEPRLALIMGSENTGMRRLTKQACDFIITIPMRNQTESLNVSVATAIALYATQMPD